MCLFFSEQPLEKSGLKRKLGSRNDPSNRRNKSPAYFIPELAHAVALCDERIPFVILAQEVSA